jgi:hypothetical protein
MTVSINCCDFKRAQANKAFSERNLETVKNTDFFEENAPSSHFLSKHGDVLSYKMMVIAHLLGCSGRWGFCGIFKHHPSPPQRG